MQVHSETTRSQQGHARIAARSASVKSVEHNAHVCNLCISFDVKATITTLLQNDMHLQASFHSNKASNVQSDAPLRGCTCQQLELSTHRDVMCNDVRRREGTCTRRVSRVYLSMARAAEPLLRNGTRQAPNRSGLCLIKKT